MFADYLGKAVLTIFHFSAVLGHIVPRYRRMIDSMIHVLQADVIVKIFFLLECLRCKFYTE
jgi:hypothetical protein